MSRDPKIVEDVQYGKNIELYCINHPSKRWRTKNIVRIGARSLFYEGEKEDIDAANYPEAGLVEEMNLRRAVMHASSECECGIDSLRPVPSPERVFV